MNLINNSTYKYLKSLGHNISFSAIAAEDKVILDFDNAIFKDSNKTYGNDLLYYDSSYELQLLMEDARVEIDTVEISLIDYYDLIDDLSSYADFLISQLNSRINRRLDHIGVYLKEEERRHEKNLDERLEMVKKIFLNVP